MSLHDHIDDGYPPPVPMKIYPNSPSGANGYLLFRCRCYLRNAREYFAAGNRAKGYAELENATLLRQYASKVRI